MITNPHRQEIKAINSVDYLFDDTDDEKNRKSPNSIRILKSVYEYANMDIGISNAVTRLAFSKSTTPTSSTGYYQGERNRKVGGISCRPKT